MSKDMAQVVIGGVDFEVVRRLEQSDKGLVWLDVKMVQVEKEEDEPKAAERER